MPDIYHVACAGGMQVLFSPVFMNDPYNTVLRPKYELGSSGEELREDFAKIHLSILIIPKLCYRPDPVELSPKIRGNHQATVAWKEASFYGFSSSTFPQLFLAFFLMHLCPM